MTPPVVTGLKKSSNKKNWGLFRALIDDRVINIEEQIDNLQQRIDGPREQQILIDNTIEARTDLQLDLQAMEWRKQIETLTEDLDHLKAARSALRGAEGVPFVWDIAFVEIFRGEKEGFDIVIGNPPYVRQESIADPNIPRERVTTANKKAYKAKLARSVYQAFPRFFRYKPERTSHPIIRHVLFPTNWTPRATSTSTSIFTDSPSSIQKERSVSSPLTHGSMSATEKTFRSLPSSTVTSSRSLTIKRGDPSPPPM